MYSYSAKSQHYSLLSTLVYSKFAEIYLAKISALFVALKLSLLILSKYSNICCYSLSFLILSHISALFVAIGLSVFILSQVFNNIRCYSLSFLVLSHILSLFVPNQVSCEHSLLLSMKAKYPWVHSQLILARTEHKQ